MRNAQIAAAVGSVRVLPDYFAMVGGLDTETPAFQKKPGFIKSGQNFESSTLGGYRRIAGYERFSGQPAPSDATYAKLGITLTGAIAVGDTVTGVSSSATGKVIVVASDSSYIVITKVTGTFQNPETLNVSAAPQATTTSLAITNGAPTALLHAQWKNLAADVYRADISAPTGEGKILGGFYYEDTCYCFRNDAGNTTASLWKSTNNGWTEVSLGYELAFTSGGNYVIAEADTIVGATSNASATVGRVVLSSGSWANGDAAGRLILTAQTNNFSAENLNVGANNDVATIAANSTAISLVAGGRYECIKENFGGASGTERVYGVDGVNRGFEFDGNVFVPINTGMTTDTPSHVIGHKGHLFYSFGSSVQHSSITDPYTWSPITGAAEIAMGDDVTGFATQPGSEANASLAIFTRNRLSILYGTSSADWVLVPYRSEIGGYPHTIQDVGFTIFLDDRGLTNIQLSQTFGNFSHNSISDRIRSKMNEFRPNAVASSISRDLSQYRIFFTNSYGFYVTVLGNKVVGITQVLFPDVVRCCWTSEDSTGAEVAFFGSDDGHVYQFEKGTSFDGDAIEAYFEMAYHFLGSPRLSKRFRDIAIEVNGSGYAGFSLGYSLGYGDTEIVQPDSRAVVTNFSSVFWDAFTWDAFIWDGSTLMPSVLTLDGTAENISLVIRSESDYYEPYTITGAVIHYSPQRRLRP